MRAWAGVALAALLAACAAPSYPTRQTAPTAPAADASPAPTPPPPAPVLATPVPRPRPIGGVAGSDACGASQMQGLVGRPRSMIPVPIDPNRQRVACTTCPAAEDSDPTRLNFLFDADTGVIRQVRCG
ncbi:peptidase inhibitor I78 [Phenylobacterium sp.]|uniref:peptidase inhibitor I78 n=1 Tax=Phenylobacterium sp. TaxID=1871053 RepID=UPI002E35D927|nr:peptidase inhibitor I78 [Phenylobacterium sp.]HEX3366954.1 peptidase inhibitor I78 [Phenylobacterium sp.]